MNISATFLKRVIQQVNKIKSELLPADSIKVVNYESRVCCPDNDTMLTERLLKSFFHLLCHKSQSH